MKEFETFYVHSTQLQGTIYIDPKEFNTVWDTYVHERAIAHLASCTPSFTYYSMSAIHVTPHLVHVYCLCINLCKACAARTDIAILSVIDIIMYFWHHDYTSTQYTQYNTYVSCACTCDVMWPRQDNTSWPPEVHVVYCIQLQVYAYGTNIKATV